MIVGKTFANDSKLEIALMGLVGNNCITELLVLMTIQKYAAVLSILAYTTDVAVALGKIVIFFTP